MKKSYKILFSLCAVFVFAFSMLLVNLQPLIAKADSISTYNVSFVAPDNSILYSTGDYVPSGSSLNSIQGSNVLLNNALLENSTGQPSYTSSSGQINIIDNWFISKGTYVVDGNTFTGTTQWDSYFAQNLDYSTFRGQTLTFSVYVSNISLTNSFRLFFNDGSLHTSTNISSTGLFTYTYTISNSASRLSAGVLLSSSSSQSISFDWLKVEVGSSFTGYYNVDYINNKLSAYNFSNYYYQYNVDTSSSITSDKYFYPEKMIQENDSWLRKTWSGKTNFLGRQVWSDGSNYYYSDGISQYVLDISTNTWSQKTWNGLTSFYGRYIWSDGSNYYYSNDDQQYVLNTSTSTWTEKTWNGLTSFSGILVWSDGSSCYYSDDDQQYVLNTSTSTWTEKIWNGLTSFKGNRVWHIGTNYYYSSGSVQYSLIPLSSTWVEKTWHGLNEFFGYDVWTDGSNYYYSHSTSQYILHVDSNYWTAVSWSVPNEGILTNFAGSDIWTTYFGTFLSVNTYQFVLGSSLIPLDSSYYYDNGYNDGYNTGYTGGYNTGYNKGYLTGVENAGNYTFFSLISSVMDAPLKVFYGLFNFELMGVNLAGFIQALLSLAILLFIIRFALQK